MISRNPIIKKFFWKIQFLRKCEISSAEKFLEGKNETEVFENFVQFEILTNSTTWTIKMKRNELTKTMKS